MTDSSTASGLAALPLRKTTANKYCTTWSKFLPPGASPQMQAHLRFAASSTAQIRRWPMAWRRFLFFRPSSRPLQARPALDSKPTVSLNCRAAHQVFWRRFLCSSAAAQRLVVAAAVWPSNPQHLFRFWLAISRSQRSSCLRLHSVLPVPHCTSQPANSTSTPPHRIARRNHSPAGFPHDTLRTLVPRKDGRRKLTHRRICVFRPPSRPLLATPFFPTGPF